MQSTTSIPGRKQRREKGTCLIPRSRTLACAILWACVIPLLVVAPAVAQRPCGRPHFDRKTVEYQMSQCGRHECSPYIMGIDCSMPGPKEWECHVPVPFEEYAHGEYIGPERTPAIIPYRLRVDDALEFIYRRTQTKSSDAYRLQVGDRIRIESLTDETLNTPEPLLILHDGSVSLRSLGSVSVAGQSVEELRQNLNERYRGLNVRNPEIHVVVEDDNAKLRELISAIDNRLSQIGGQSLQTVITPEGTVTLPAVGSVRAHGLTLDELRYELNRRYETQAHGLEVTPLLQQRAPRFVYVAGEVVQPGRYELVGPTSVNQAIAMAQGRVNGAHLTQVVVYRRGYDWRLTATMINVRPALQGTRPCPSDEIWLRDSDIVVVPRSRLRVATDFIDLAFTRGIYSVFPVNFNTQLTQLNNNR